jgi:hypothetical protein
MESHDLDDLVTDGSIILKWILGFGHVTGWNLFKIKLKGRFVLFAQYC